MSTICLASPGDYTFHERVTVVLFRVDFEAPRTDNIHYLQHHTDRADRTMEELLDLPPEPTGEGYQPSQLTLLGLSAETSTKSLSTVNERSVLS